MLSSLSSLISNGSYASLLTHCRPRGDARLLPSPAPPSSGNSTRPPPLHRLLNSSPRRARGDCLQADLFPVSPYPIRSHQPKTPAAAGPETRSCPAMDRPRRRPCRASTTSMSSNNDSTVYISVIDAVISMVRSARIPSSMESTTWDCRPRRRCRCRCPPQPPAAAALDRIASPRCPGTE